MNNNTERVNTEVNKKDDISKNKFLSFNQHDNFSDKNNNIYKLVLIRHGESLFNQENIFTGWKDVDLSKKGIKEAYITGKILKIILINLIYALHQN